MSKAKDEIDISKITIDKPNKIENSSQDIHSIDKTPLKNMLSN